MIVCDILGLYLCSDVRVKVPVRFTVELQLMLFVGKWLIRDLVRLPFHRL